VSIRIVGPGAFTTVQDLGRPGWGSAGVPPSGAMDEIACRRANLLVGNDPGAAVLEITMAGPEVLFLEDHVCALAGARFDATLDGDAVGIGRSFAASAGSTLSIGNAREGVRGYLALAGGLATPLVLGSRSTLVSAGLGGLEGRALRGGDELPLGDRPRTDAPRSREAALPPAEGERVARAVPGPQEEAFRAGSLDAFFSTTFRVSPRSDRAGVRLDGPRLEHVGGADLDPEGVVTGAVQVPADGMPIVLGPDRPATGGYVKIATVIAADLPLIAQARPGDSLRFVPTDVDSARAAWRERIAGITGDG
jgi:biotin-dependent carboxylase-like uncharacterized protein